MKKKWILMGILIGLLTVGAGCNVGDEQSSSSVKNPPASESSAVVSSEETSFDNTENSTGTSTENSVASDESIAESSSDETPENQYYTVWFDTDGGSEVKSVQVKSGEKVAMPDPPKKSSMDAEYEFIGWYYGETEWDFENGIVTQDMVLTAKWKTLESYTPPFLPKD